MMMAIEKEKHHDIGGGYAECAENAGERNKSSPCNIGGW